MKTQSKPAFVYYLYAFTGADALIIPRIKTLKGLDGTPVEFMKVKSIVVAFGKLSGQEYSKDNVEAKLKDLSWLEQRIYEHYHVQQALAAGRCAIVPFKFCTLFKTKRKIQEFITEQHPFIINLLGRLQGTQEWSVKVFRNNQIFKKNLSRFDLDIGARIQTLKSESDGKAFLLKKKLLQDIEAASAKLTKSCVLKLVEDLKNISLEWRQNETFAVPEKKDEEMVANFPGEGGGLMATWARLLWSAGDGGPPLGARSARGGWLRGVAPASEREPGRDSWTGMGERATALRGRTTVT